MNIRVASFIILLALLAISLAPTIVSAQTGALEVYTVLTMPGNEIYFYLNRTAIPIAGHPVVVASQLVFFLSTNGYSVITEGDIKIAEIVVGGSSLIFGSLLVPSYVPEGSYWLKVAGAPVIGADAIVSTTRVYITKDPSKLVSLIYRDLSQLEVNLPVVTTSNAFMVTVDVAEIKAVTSEESEYEPAGATLKVGLLKGETTRFFVSGVIGDVNTTTSANSNFLYNAIIARTATDISVEGTLADFGLPLEDIKVCTTVLGVPVVCAEYGVKVDITRERTFSGLHIVRGEPVGEKTDCTIEVSEVSVRLAEETRIYPSSISIVMTDSTIAGPVDKMNVGDVVTLDLRNFVNGNRIIVFRTFVVQEDSLQLLGEVPMNVTVVDGSAQIALTLQPLPYGGRTVLILAMDSEWLGYALFDPTQAFSVTPYFIAKAFDNAGNLIDPTFVPGEYIYIRGYGFIIESFEFVLRVNATEIPLIVVAGPLTCSKTGDIALVVQIPGDAEIDEGATVTLTVRGATEGNSYSLEGVATYGVIRVYVNPVVVLKALNEPPKLILSELVTKYPSGTEWLAEDMVTIGTVEVFGFQPGTNVSVTLDDYVLIPTTLLSTGYLKQIVKTPVEIPYGTYNVYANGYESVTVVQIRSTFATFVNSDLLAYGYDPDKTELTISLPMPLDLTLRGLGFSPQGVIDITVTRAGDTVPVLAEYLETNEHGSFTYTLALSGLTPGLYVVEIYDVNAGVGYKLEVSIAKLPTLTVKIATAVGQFAELPVNVWALVLLDNEGLVPDNVYYYNLSGVVVYFTGTEYRELTQLKFVYTGMPGLFHAVFVPGAELKGTNAAIIVTVGVKVHTLTPVQRTSEIVSFVVPPYTLAELAQVANDINMRLDTLAKALATFDERTSAQFTTLATKLDAISTELRTATALIRTDLATVSSKLDSLLAITSLIQTDVGIVKSTTEAIGATLSTIDTRTGEIRTLVGAMSTKVDTIATRVDAINTAVGGLATKSDVREARDAATSAVDRAKGDILSKLDEVASLAEAAAGVRTLALINIILTLAVLALAAYVVFAKKG
ncbi:MAG: hypothetical protein QXE35_04360 [Acidilobaceae archaeon]